MNEKLTSMTVPSTPAGVAYVDPERWLEEYGDYLFKFALVRVRDPVKAEDLLQETFLAALKSGSTFAGRSAEKTWLAGILKHKIIDHFRRAGRETCFTDLEFYKDEEGDRFIPDGMFAGGWIHELGPAEWPHPSAALDDQAFWKMLQHCSNKLPRKISTVFTLRELDGVESKDICEILNISESNLWVMLHRARMALRRCLETHWFARQT